MSRLPAYGKQLMTRRQAGERISMVVVAIRDWQAGEALASLPNTARLVVGDDCLPHQLDWSCVVGIDCLLVGGCDASVLYAAALMADAAGAASVWAEFDDGVWRLERMAPAVWRHGFVAVDGPVALGDMPAAISVQRDWCLMRHAGIYASPVFDAARRDLFGRCFGPAAEPMAERMARLFGNRKAA